MDVDLTRDDSENRLCGQRPNRGCLKCDVRLISICDALDPAELEALEHINHATTFAPKTALFEQGGAAGSFFSVTEGMVRLYKSLPDGRRQITGFALTGDFLGLALLDRYGITAEAVTQVHACRFNRRSFLDYIDDKPHLLRRLHEFAEHELSLAQEQMLLLGRKTAEEKMAAFLINLQRRYSRIAPISVTIALPMSRQDIADYLGLTIETVSRTLTRMAREKTILIVPDGVRLLSPHRLDALTAA